MNRRVLLKTLLTAPAALWALTRGNARVEDFTVNGSPGQVGILTPRAALCYQRLYTKLTERVVPLRGHYSVPLRTRYITGWHAEGIDRFRQLEVRKDGEWVADDCWRVGQIDGSIRLRGFCLDRLSYSPNGAPWALGVVAIARWSEWAPTEAKGQA